MSVTGVLTVCPICEVQADHKFLAKKNKYRCGFCFNTWTSAQLVAFLNKRSAHHHHVVLS